MSLKDRIKAKKEVRPDTEKSEYKLSVAKISKAIGSVKNPSDLGKIIKEFSKFLNTLEANNASIVFSGDFDMGQKTLLNCMLANFMEDGSKKVLLLENEDVEKPVSKLIKKRKSLKAKLAEKTEAE